jgi:hypothetical protein
MAELANGSVIHPRDQGSNLGADRLFSYSVCIGIVFVSVGR